MSTIWQRTIDVYLVFLITPCPTLIYLLWVGCRMDQAHFLSSDIRTIRDTSVLHQQWKQLLRLFQHDPKRLPQLNQTYLL
ncbi:hypothetical protein LX32DRAFT_604 [Colletotrichum zoysiae]|uniref:Uncharacterized protein n=1 Tax=Colletotrichum zoysiae TaxID=1216348 RepID=A0AAD9MAK1_9PEZI|nr:hypothetical protein LX32DRAFT_604 [Colletotrichum zoysiae]